MPDLFVLAQQVAIWAIPVLLAATVHEAACAAAARALGHGPVATPGTGGLLRRADPVGTFAFPALLVLLGNPVVFAWARPAALPPASGRRPRDLALVAIAGPAANLLMAIGWVLMLWCYQRAGEPGGGWALLRDLGVAGVAVNVVLLTVHAFVPVPPLAAGRVAMLVLPRRLSLLLSRLEPWGLAIVATLVAAGIAYRCLFWPLVGIETILYQAFSVSLTDP